MMFTDLVSFDLTDRLYLNIDSFMSDSFIMAFSNVTMWLFYFNSTNMVFCIKQQVHILQMIVNQGSLLFLT